MIMLFRNVHGSRSQRCELVATFNSQQSEHQRGSTRQAQMGGGDGLTRRIPRRDQAFLPTKCSQVDNPSGQLIPVTRVPSREAHGPGRCRQLAFLCL